MRLILIIFIAAGNPIFSQELIEGEFDSASNMFVQGKMNFWVSEFLGENASFSRNGLYGVINKSGEVITPMVYDDVHLTDSVFYAKRKNRYFIISQKGEVIGETENDFVIDEKGLQFFFNATHSYLTVTPSFNRPSEGVFTLGRTLYDLNGDFIFELPKGCKTKFKDGMAQITYYCPEGRSCGYINRKGEEAIPNTYSLCSDFESGFAVVSSSKGRAIIDKEGNVVFPYSHDIPRETTYSNGLVRYRDSTSNKIGFTDIRGQMKLPFIYDKASNFLDGYASVEVNGEAYTIDVNGKKYSAQKYPFEQGYRFSQTNDKIVYEDKNGREIFEYDYEKQPDKFTEGLMVVSLNGKLGVIDLLGVPVVPPLYRKIVISHGHIMVLDDNSIRAINKETKKELKWSDLSVNRFGVMNFSTEGFLKTDSVQKVGLMDTELRRILANKFDKITVRPTFISATNDEGIGIYNLNGELKIQHQKNQYCKTYTNKGFILVRPDSLILFDNDFIPRLGIDSVNYQFDYQNMGEQKPKNVLSGIAIFKDKKNSKLGYMDIFNMEMSDAIYDEIVSLRKMHLLHLYRDDLCVLFNPLTKEMKTYEYEFRVTDEVNSKLSIVEKWPYPKSKLSKMSPFPYNSQRYGLMNEMGEIIEPFDYTNIRRFNRNPNFVYEGRTVSPEAILCTKVKAKYLLFDKQGKRLPFFKED